MSAADYTTNSLVVSNSASLSVNGSSPTRIYLSDSSFGSTSPVASINGGSVNTGGLPANFQIFYGGSGILDLSSTSGSPTTITGTIYAPNATVYMSNTVVNGAVVAGQISGPPDSNGNLQVAQKVTINYDMSLSNPSELKASKALGLLNDPSAIAASLAGTNSSTTGIFPLQVRYYSEQARLH